MPDIRRRLERLEQRGGPGSELFHYWLNILAGLRAMRVRAEARRGTDWSPPSDQELSEEAKVLAARGTTLATELWRAWLAMQATRAAAQQGRDGEG